MISIYKTEMKGIYLLADLIVQNTISDSFRPDWKPDLKAIWPSLRYDPQNALDRALDARDEIRPKRSEFLRKPRSPQ